MWSLWVRPLMGLLYVPVCVGLGWGHPRGIGYGLAACSPSGCSTPTEGQLSPKMTQAEEGLVKCINQGLPSP
jgi:hypothetical protein